MRIRKIFENRELSELDLQGFKDMGIEVINSLMVCKNNKITYIIVPNYLTNNVFYTTEDYTSVNSTQPENVFWLLFEDEKFEWDNIYTSYTLVLDNKNLPKNSNEIFSEINLIKDQSLYQEVFIHNGLLYISYSSGIVDIEKHNNTIIDISKEILGISFGDINDSYDDGNVIIVFYTSEEDIRQERINLSNLLYNKGYSVEIDIQSLEDEESERQCTITVNNYPIK